MCSNSFETLMRIDRKEVGQLRGFPVLWMGIIENVQMEGKQCKDKDRLKTRARAWEVLQHGIDITSLG